MRKTIGEAGLLSDDTRSEVLFRECTSTYRAYNPSGLRVLRYKVDGGIITIGSRCDYLLGIVSRRECYLIELKGSDIKKAAEQILATLDALGPRFDKYVVSARIVLTRTPRPDLRSSILIKLERQIARLGGRVFRANRELSEQL